MTVATAYTKPLASFEPPFSLPPPALLIKRSCLTFSFYQHPRASVTEGPQMQVSQQQINSNISSLSFN